MGSYGNGVVRTKGKTTSRKKLWVKNKTYYKQRYPMFSLKLF